MRYYSIVIAGAPGSFPPRYDGGAQWGTEFNGQYDPGAQQVEFQIEEFRPNFPSADSTLTIHGVTFQQIKDTGFLIGLPISIYGGMRPGLPIATAQSVKAGLLMQGQILRAWGNWIGTEMSIGMTFAPAGESNAQDSNSQDSSGGESSSGGGGESSSGGGGESSSGGQVMLRGLSGVPGTRRVRRSRAVGFRSIDRRPYARGAVTPPGADNPVVTPSDIGDIGELSPQPAIGAATTFAGGVASSFFGGGISGLQAPLNIIHNIGGGGGGGGGLSSAIQQTLSIAFPRGNANVAISPGLQLGYQDAGFYQNLQQYAQYINSLSQSILGIKNYIGVQFSAKDNTINVWDGTTPVGEGQIAAIDLIGQPTWIDINMISIKTILRGDITCGMVVTLPQTLISLTPQAIIQGGPASEQKTNTSFHGAFLVRRILHIGDFRNPDGVGWSSNFECYFLGEVSATSPGSTVPAQVT
jgi:hypothetical protein